MHNITEIKDELKTVLDKAGVAWHDDGPGVSDYAVWILDGKFGFCLERDDSEPTGRYLLVDADGQPDGDALSLSDIEWGLQYGRLAELIAIKYSAIAKNAQGDIVATISEVSETAARESALGLSADYPDCQIFVTWSRRRDGQKGYLNPDGNHAPVGKNWNE